MNVKIPGLKYNKTINEQLYVFETHLNKYGSMLLEIQELRAKQEDFIKWLEDKVNELSDIICEDNMNRISTTYEEAKKVVYQEILEKIKGAEK